MNKTPIGSRFLNELTKVNDQLCCSALLHKEFKTKVLRHAETSPDDFTSAIFPFNPYSEKLHRRAEDLPAFCSLSRDTSFRMAMIAGYEYLLAYLKDVQDLRANIAPSSEDSIQEGAPEEQVFKKLEAWMPTSPERGYSNTLAYCRHMRNSFAHAHDRPSNEFTAFAKNHRHALSKFWGKRPIQLHEFNFNAKTSYKLSAATSFTTMNLMRACLKEIDSMFASTLRLENVLPGTVDEIVLSRPELKTNCTRVAQKSRKKIAMDYGEQFPKHVVSPIVEQLLDA